MKLLILYRPNSDHGRKVEEFVREYQARNQAEGLELINIDTKAGYDKAAVYDITSYPAILVLQNDGSPQNIWQGDELPLIDEVASYTHA